MRGDKRAPNAAPSEPLGPQEQHGPESGPWALCRRALVPHILQSAAPLLTPLLHRLPNGTWLSIAGPSVIADGCGSLWLSEARARLRLCTLVRNTCSGGATPIDAFSIGTV